MVCSFSDATEVYLSGGSTIDGKRPVMVNVIMDKRKKEVSIAVCLVEHNPLALEFLLNLLSIRMKGKISSFDKYVKENPPPAKKKQTASSFAS